MVDMSRTAADADAPVNPFSLREAVNSSSDTVNTAWLIFLTIMAYVVITVAGISHRDLLLNNDIPLPVLQVKIDLTRFFLFAPLLLVLFHLGVVSQLVLLARKAMELDAAIRQIEPTDARSHPLRLEIDNFFFVQAIAGPDRSMIISGFLHGLSWLTLVVLPVMVLLYIQVVFLPYHDIGMTWAHRLIVLADIVMLIGIGVFLVKADTSFFRAFHRTSRSNPVSFAVTSVVLMLVALFSLFVATVPGEPLDRITQTRLSGRHSNSALIPGFAAPFWHARSDGSLFGMFQRNLVVTDTDMVIDKDVTPGETSVNLRGRDLRFARLDRSDLHQADFTGADLEGASLQAADLRGVKMACTDIGTLLLGGDGDEAKCTRARRANFSRAQLMDARLSGIDLQSAIFDEADMTGADLSQGLMKVAKFNGTQLGRAELSGGSFHGASFLGAQMQGSNLAGAKMLLADLKSANLNGAFMMHIQLEGASLDNADMTAADLQQARLHGARLDHVTVTAADLRGASFWRTMPPDADQSGLADFTGVIARPFASDEIADLRRAIEYIEDESVQVRAKEALGPLFGDEDAAAWKDAPEHQRWQALIAAGRGTGDGYKSRLTEQVVRMVCRSRWSALGIGPGLVRRAKSPLFKGDGVAVYDRIRADDCIGGKHVPAKLMQDFVTAIDGQRAQ
jgi:uncharacterized protein YjbI with pentapeptide repeats